MKIYICIYIYIYIYGPINMKSFKCHDLQKLTSYQFHIKIDVIKMNIHVFSGFKLKVLWVEMIAEISISMP